MTDTSPENTKQKQAKGRWQRGQSGNPAGKPRGARHAALLALDAIGAEGAEDVLRAVVEAAKGKDMRAADIVLRRLWPERKGRQVVLDLPVMNTAADLAGALGAVTRSVAAGDISPEEGQALASIFEAHCKAFDTSDHERRIAELEAKGVGSR